MIQSFSDRLSEDLFDDRHTKRTQKLSSSLRRPARRKLLYLHEAEDLKDLRVPPENHLEALKGKWKGYYSIRINNQLRIIFRWVRGNALEVRIIDYHKG